MVHGIIKMGLDELIIIVAARIFGKPSFLRSFALFKEFFDRPKATEAEYAQHAACNNVGAYECTTTTENANYQEHPPEAGACIIFCFDDNGVK